MDYIIEYDVPLPPRRPGAMCILCKFHEMKVGGSMLIPDKELNQVVSAVYAFKRKHGGEFTTRTTREGIRVWRIA